MTTDKIHLAHCILYEFQQGINATEAYRNLLKVFDESDFNLSDKPRSGRPSWIDDDTVKIILEQNPFLTTLEIVERLDSAEQTISDHIRKLVLVWKYSKWVPHELICTKQNGTLLGPDVITGDEKWITYENIIRKRAYCEPGKPVSSTFKVKPNEKLNLERYCQQLDNLKTALQEKRPAIFNRKDIILLHDNARPHTALRTRQKLAELSWEILLHPPYSPDLGKKFKNEADIRQTLVQFFASGDKAFFKNGTYKLPLRRQEVINNYGNYIIQ
ncbi:histone-lysine N-methyltransferase SETMAR-like [Vespa crabro]|uniref:histone-lysine N-methyltransferase SETMAR-like n=1 Tax=Vespa crabro TaxID=7445 RepID=UPI001F030E62|nr:histone-lysine N-methyltransferase SETMAR-like [Vespa crabro]